MLIQTDVQSTQTDLKLKNPQSGTQNIAEMSEMSALLKNMRNTEAFPKTAGMQRTSC
ncbi:hypothetical protein D3C78_1882240 [compost metagenome]